MWRSDENDLIPSRSMNIELKTAMKKQVRIINNQLSLLVEQDTIMEQVVKFPNEF